MKAVVFPLLAIAGLILAVWVPKAEIHRGVRLHSLLVSFRSPFRDVVVMAMRSGPR